MRVVVLVPRRADNGRRDHLWQYVKGRWNDLHPLFEVFEGEDETDLPFNRSAALNRAAKAAGDWDVALVVDADTFAGPTQIESAVLHAAITGRFTLCFDRWCALNQDMSDAIMKGFDGDWTPGVYASMGGTCSSLIAIPRELWDAVDGFDEGFVSWGGEDVAFWRACETLGGGFDRIPGDCWHLHHESAPRPRITENVARCERYGAAAYNVDAMRTLIAELHA